MTTTITATSDGLSGELAVNGVTKLRAGAPGITLIPPASATPENNGDLVFQLTSNTSLVIKVKGSDGTVRSTTLTLA